MKTAAGDTPLFGFYGSGEIGHRKNGEASCGDGYHISVCAITPAAKEWSDTKSVDFLIPLLHMGSLES
jgi:hypothetical protein